MREGYFAEFALDAALGWDWVAGTKGVSLQGALFHDLFILTNLQVFS